MFSDFQGVVLPSDGMKGHIGGEDIEAAVGYTEHSEMDAEVVKTNQSKANYEDSNSNTIFDDER